MPDGPSDIATFDASNITSVSLDGEFQLAEVVFNPGASAFTLVAGYPGLSFYEAGITNNSGVVQTLAADSDLASEMNFYNSATAGENTILYERGATIDDNTKIFFHDTSSAGSATIINEGNLDPYGGTYFYDSSTAAKRPSSTAQAVLRLRSLTTPRMQAARLLFAKAGPRSGVC